MAKVELLIASVPNSFSPAVSEASEPFSEEYSLPATPITATVASVNTSRSTPDRVSVPTTIVPLETASDDGIATPMLAVSIPARPASTFAPLFAVIVFASVLPVTSALPSPARMTELVDPSVNARPEAPAAASRVRFAVLTVNGLPVNATPSNLTVSPIAATTRPLATLAPEFTNTVFALTVTRPSEVVSSLSVILPAIVKFSASVAVAPVLPPKVAVVASMLPAFETSLT